VPLQDPIHVARHSGLGDILMCTPALREFKHLYPLRRIHFYTRYIPLLVGLPYIDTVSPVEDSPSDAIWLQYNNAVYSGKHFASAIGECIGVDVTDVRPDCVVDPTLVQTFKNAWNHLPRPHVLVQRRASAWTLNRNWPNSHWEKLIASLLQTCTVIEIGKDARKEMAAGAPNYFDLRYVSAIELVACIAAADILAGPDSGPVHVAAAVHTPAVVILGGYLLPGSTAYPGNTIFHSPIHCSPCLLRTPCPKNLECLDRIAPETVEQAILETWSRRRNSGPADLVNPPLIRAPEWSPSGAE
jgi:ADP-heptose:LPS heptosyltransferase